MAYIFRPPGRRIKGPLLFLRWPGRTDHLGAVTGQVPAHLLKHGGERTALHLLLRPRGIHSSCAPSFPIDRPPVYGLLWPPSVYWPNRRSGRRPYTFSDYPSKHFGERGQRRRAGVLRPGPMIHWETPSYGALPLGSCYLLRGGELRGVSAAKVGGSGRYGLPRRNLGGRREGEGGVTREVCCNVLLADEGPALVSRRVREELDQVANITPAVQGALDRRLARDGLCGGDDRLVLQAVRPRVHVAGVVGCPARSVLDAAHEVYAQPGVREDGVARDRVAAATAHHDPVLAVEGYGVGPRRCAVPDRVVQANDQNSALVVAEGAGPARGGANAVAEYHGVVRSGMNLQAVCAVAANYVAGDRRLAPDDDALGVVEEDAVEVVAEVLGAAPVGANVVALDAVGLGRHAADGIAARLDAAPVAAYEVARGQGGAPDYHLLGRAVVDGDTGAAVAPIEGAGGVGAYEVTLDAVPDGVAGYVDTRAAEAVYDETLDHAV